MNTKHKARFDWKGVKTVTFSIDNAKSGGLGMYAITMLKDAGIPARRGVTPYQDHVAIEVPAKFERRAAKLVL